MCFAKNRNTLALETKSFAGGPPTTLKEYALDAFEQRLVVTVQNASTRAEVACALTLSQVHLPLSVCGFDALRTAVAMTFARLTQGEREVIDRSRIAIRTSEVRSGDRNLRDLDSGTTSWRALWGMPPETVAQ
jgi:hypothetical protein